jgi:hypothetical protein
MEINEDEATIWNELSRFEQRVLIKLFGGGTLRNDSPAIVDALRIRGLVDENSKLSMFELKLLTRAMRKR